MTQLNDRELAHVLLALRHMQELPDEAYTELCDDSYHVGDMFEHMSKKEIDSLCSKLNTLDTVE